MSNFSNKEQIAEDISDIIKLKEERGSTYRHIGSLLGIPTQKVIRMFLGYQYMSESIHQQILTLFKEGKI